jgi:hypothetical protein
MATRQETANAVYRDYEVDGVPTSGAHEPAKSEIRAYEALQNAAIDALLDATSPSYLGTWNATTNTPTITSSVGTAGNYYIVSVAGSTSINGVDAWDVGDKIIFSGSVWQRVPAPAVSSGDIAPSDRVSGGPYAFGVIDAADNALAGANSDSRWETGAGIAWRATVGRLLQRVVEPVVTFLDGIGVGFNARTGDIVANGIQVPAGESRLDQAGLLPVVRSIAGIPIGLRPDGGAVFKVGKGSETWVPSSAAIGFGDAFNLRYDGDRGVVGTMQDADGYTYDFYQQRTIFTRAGVAISARGIEGGIGVGQSHMGAASGPTGGPPWTSNLTPQHALMIENALEHEGGGLWSSFANPTDDFLPLAHPTGYGQSILAMTVDSVIAFERDSGVRNAAMPVVASWRGSTPIEDFFPASSGVYLYENAVEEIERMAEVAERYPLPFRLAWLLFIQGENNNSTADTWETLFNSYIDTVVPDFAAAAGQSANPAILLVQTGTGTGVAPNINCLGQLAVARSRGSPAVTLVGPMYQYKIHNGGTSGIQSLVHIDDEGRMMLGEAAAIAYDYAVRRGIAWHALWPTAGGVTRVNNVITIPLELPPGCSELMLDTDYVALSGVTTHGFAFSQTGGNSPVIQSVAIDGTDIVVTLDITPTGTSQTIDYAFGNDNADTGWMTGRGTVYSPDPRISVWYRRGFNVHVNPRHYLVRFRESIA